MQSLGEFIENNKYLEKLYLGYNLITDKGIEVLSEYLIGNTTLKILAVLGNKLITDASQPYVVQIAKTSCITAIDVSLTSISDRNRLKIIELLKTPIDQREIPIKSNTKSASKITSVISVSKNGTNA